MLTSKQNQQIKLLKKIQTKKGRQRFGAYLIEGPHLVAMAIQLSMPIQMIYSTPNAWDDSYASYDYEEISEEIAHYLSDTGHSQGVIATLPLNEAPLPNWQSLEEPLILLDAIQDPGNLGTIIRTADALGYRYVILGKGTVDLYNDKVLRSMQGSHFRLQIISADLTQLIPELQQSGYQIAATALDSQAVPLPELTFKQSKWGVMFGNEGNGIHSSLLNMADKTCYIPMSGDAESFNVAIAAAITMYQLGLS